MSIASCGTSRKLKARESCLSRDPSIERLRANRLLKKTHMLRCAQIASLQRTVSTPPLVDFSRASPLDLFEQPARGFFSNLLKLEIRSFRVSVDDIWRIVMRNLRFFLGVLTIVLSIAAS